MRSVGAAAAGVCTLPGMEFLPGVSRLSDLSGRHLNQWLSIRMQVPIVAIYHDPGTVPLGEPRVTLTLNMQGTNFEISLHPNTEAYVLA